MIPQAAIERGKQDKIYRMYLSIRRQIGLRLSALLAAALQIAFLCMHAGSANAALLSCPGNLGEPLPQMQDERAALVIQLDKQMPECGEDAGFLAWYGALLNSLGRPGEAALLLERALLQNPDHAGARADYAESLLMLGDRGTARNLLNELVHRPDLPPHLEHTFRERLERLDKFPVIVASSWDRNASMSLRVGYESNLNNAPSQTSVEITLPQGVAELELSESSRRQAGTAWLVEAGALIKGPLGHGIGITLAGEMKARQSPSMTGTDYAQLDLLSQINVPIGEGSVLLDVGTSQFQYDGVHLYQSRRGSMAWQEAISQCQLRGGAELENRRYPVNSLLDGKFRALSLSARCPFGSGIAGVFLRTGRDLADNPDRPGGDHQRQEMRALLAHRWGSGTVQVDAQYSRQDDTQAYSPLLAEGAARRIDRIALRAEYIHPVNLEWDLLANIEASRQRSNISLFEIQNLAFWLGLRWNYR